MTPLTTRFRAEFDQETKILLIRVAGRLTDESMTELDEASRKYSTTTGAKVGIVDLSSVTEFALSTEFIRQRARQKPSTAVPCIVVAPQAYAFGLFRMRTAINLTHLGRGVCNTRHSVPTLQAVSRPAPFSRISQEYRSDIATTMQGSMHS
jgi:hypothetical protein